MDFEKIKELIKLVDSSTLAFFEFQNENDYMKMDKSLERRIIKNRVDEAKALTPISNSATENVISQVFKSSCEEKLGSIVNSEIEKEMSIDNEILKVITSPMVGTFYSKVSPDSEPFIKVGDETTIGKIICIVEAMKLMNEIESDYAGKIVEILVKDGQMVEYGQPLFKVKGE
ncbi:biotin carboxyl carrier protein of acetyl-CoA carboxylase [Clostridium puniceum]|uniref:Biotin carboxyl carrier protein of acetyl-CoA carboxylase n=1 Tax=Clostridium puniceum TaxID=29367 RepID=A0A1S8SX59_9CLOT|nr:acetyl-CoA carboxylase biotin carboxyl carrier protein [Clostridium puniceum]OOM69991.1 biotin carboxyl carrier protein of acetyl-CoA carboxylase [Clostridium puniceum]